MGPGRGGVSTQEMAAPEQPVRPGKSRVQEMATHEQLVGPGRGEEIRVGERGGGRVAKEQRREERTAIRGQEATHADIGRVVGGARAAARKEPGLPI